MARRATALVGRMEEVTTPNGHLESETTTAPYIVRVTIVGVSPLLFHAWVAEAIDEKASLVKGDKNKKKDFLETYVWRDQEGYICLPGEYLRMSIVNSAKSIQDPRSPRKSAMELYKAGLIALTDLARLENTTKDTRGDQSVPIGKEGRGGWDSEDRRRVMVQRQGVNRTRPCFHKGWRATIDLLVNLPEYIPFNTLRERIINAGKTIGVADFRPTYGRFVIERIEQLPEDA